MNIGGYLRRNWKLLLNIITILALLVLVIALRDDFVSTYNNFWHVRGWVLLLLFPIEAVNYLAQAKVYQKLFAAFGKAINFKNWLLIAVELNFVNHVFPSGGVSGVSYFGYRLKQYGVGRGRASLVQTMKLILLFVSFELLLVLAMILLAVSGKASDTVVFISTVLIMLVLFGTLVFAYVISSLERIRTFVTALALVANRLIQLVRVHHPSAIKTERYEGILEEYHRDFMQLRSHFNELLAPFWWSLIANASEVLAVYVVYAAFGEFVNLGAVIIAYAVANFAGLISVLPGGTGIYEALMTLTLAAAGIPARLSLPVTIMYRVLNTLIQLPPGFILYQRTLRQAPEEALQ